MSMEGCIEYRWRFLFGDFYPALCIWDAIFEPTHLSLSESLQGCVQWQWQSLAEAQATQLLIDLSRKNSKLPDQARVVGRWQASISINCSCSQACPALVQAANQQIVFAYFILAWACDHLLKKALWPSTLQASIWKLLPLYYIHTLVLHSTFFVLAFGVHTL